MKKQEFKDFLTTLKPDSNTKKVQDKIKVLTSDFKDYFYFNTAASAWHFSDRKSTTTINLNFNFYIPMLNSEENLEVFLSCLINGEKSDKKILFTSFEELSWSVNFIDIEPFSAGIIMYGVEEKNQAIYTELSTDKANLQFNNEINSYTKSEKFTEYINKVRNEFILPYLLNKMDNDLIKVKMGENMIIINMPKSNRMEFIKGVSGACTQLIDDILNPDNEKSVVINSIVKALTTHDNKNHAQLLEKQLPVKEGLSRLRKI